MWPSFRASIGRQPQNDHVHADAQLQRGDGHGKAGRAASGFERELVADVVVVGEVCKEGHVEVHAAFPRVDMASDEEVLATAVERWAISRRASSADAFS